jgi:uncharacterized protein
MLKELICSSILLSAVFLSNGVALADNAPTLDQVYTAAHAGKLEDAQRMMDIVLKEHPDSAKAPFVEAELLAKQGQLGKAQAELQTAEQLKPDLPFAKPQAVKDLKIKIFFGMQSINQASTTNLQAESGNSFPWGMLLLGVAAIAAIILIMRAMNSRNAQTFPGSYQTGMQNRTASPVPMQPYGGGMAPMAPVGGGIGSGIMGGLATGAAVGVGMVAGEALAHHFMDGSHNNNSSIAPVADTWGNNSNDLGGTDFGIADNSSWSDSSSIADNGSDVGGSDWS